ncbi:MAG TPA: YbaB/EbfC family nucleoid-associated protein [Streptosporangiaceae bacterium]
MEAEWQAHIDELLEKYREKRAQLKELQRSVGEAGATVTTEDEMITVKVGSQGRLVGLEFNPRVYRKLSPSELAEAVLAAVREASSQVDGQVRAALQPMMSDRDYGEVGGFDLSKILPERPDDLDAFREKYGLRPKPDES